MKVNRTHIAGIVAVVVVAAYSLSRWGDASDDAGEQASTTEHRNFTAD